MPWITTALLSLLWGAIIVGDVRSFSSFHSATANNSSAIPPLVQYHPSAFNLGSITALNLFGKVEVSPAQIDVAALPDASSNLKLVGLLVSSRPGASRSLIAESGSSAKYYLEGDSLPGNIKLLRIEKDCVVVQRGDLLEKLKLPGSSIAKPTALTRSIAETIRARMEKISPEAPPTISTNEADKSTGPQAIYQTLNASLAALKEKKK